MRIDEAKSILTHQIVNLKTGYDHDRFVAICLGIEALKRLEELRTPSSGNPHILLPSETEE